MEDGSQDLPQEEQEPLDEGALLQAALQFDPENPVTHFHMGRYLRRHGNPSQALLHFQEAVRMHPDFAEAWTDLGELLFAMDEHATAAECLKRSLRLKPHQPPALFNLGILSQEYDRHEAAISFFDQAIQINPNYHLAYVGKAFSLLKMGCFAEGWALYNWRRACTESEDQASMQPEWFGEPLNGKTILIQSEQGFGDLLHFCRYIPQLRQMGARVLLSCRPPLVRLLTIANIADEILTPPPIDEDWPDHDYFLPLLNLPERFHTTLSTIPNTVPYLQSDPQNVLAWQQKVAPFDKLKVGLVWSGNPKAAANRHRACRLAHLVPLLAIPGIEWFSLQLDAPAKELSTLPEALPIHDLTPDIHDFADTAAALSCLDLLIATDTAIVHLAGALGKPVWTLLHTSSEWRWLRSRDDSPWYPTMRLFRQTEPRSWKNVVDQVYKELIHYINNPRS